MRSGLSRTEIEGRIRELVEALFVNIPSGVGSHRKDLRLKREEERQVLRKGARWAIERGYGDESDLEYIEEGGCLEGADPEEVSDRAMERGKDQLGTLGSGNHFVEVGYVAEIFDERIAREMGLWKDQVTVFVHTGSRGLGHQVCDDYIRVMMDAARKYEIQLPDPQLCCAPVSSQEGERYLRAMAGAANFAFTNRQMISHWVRETFEAVFQRGPRDLKLELIYDVCHNIAKIETHTIQGQRKKVCVHRKGATRAFPPGHPEVPEKVSIHWPACSDPRRHGQMLLCAGWNREGHGGDLRKHLPWSRPADEPSSGGESGEGEGDRKGIGRQGDLCEGGKPRHPCRRDSGGL